MEKILAGKPKDSHRIVVDSSGILPPIKELSPPLNLDNYNPVEDEQQLIGWLLEMDVSQVPRKTTAVYPARMLELSKHSINKRLEKYGLDLSQISEEDKKHVERFGVRFKTPTEDEVRRRCILDFLINQFGSIRGIEKNISPQGLAKLGFKIERFGTQINIRPIK